MMAVNKITNISSSTIINITSTSPAMGFVGIYFVGEEEGWGPLLTDSAPREQDSATGHRTQPNKPSAEPAVVTLAFLGTRKMYELLGVLDVRQ